MAENNDNIKQLVARLKEIKQQSNVTIPAWMLDENRYGKGALTLDEQHEWAETVCQSMRSTVALTYLIECEKRWGLRDGEYQFKTGEFVFGLTRELIENLLIEHVEGALLEQKTTGAISGCLPVLLRQRSAPERRRSFVVCRVSRRHVGGSRRAVKSWRKSASETSFALRSSEDGNEN